MAIPEKLRVDFSALENFDLITDGLSKMLSCFYSACTLRQFVSILIRECEELYQAAIDVEKYRTIFDASGVNLDALGRIVGEPRAPYQYSENYWMFADRVGQTPDNTPVYVLNAPFEVYVPVEDAQFKYNILYRILKNHTLCASVPEIASLLNVLIGTWVGFKKTGPMEVDIYVNAEVSKTQLAILTLAHDTLQADDVYSVSYPATLKINKITFLPVNPFTADVSDQRRCDSGLCAVTTGEFLP